MPIVDVFIALIAMKYIANNVKNIVTNSAKIVPPDQ